jgi:hypothetical protein
MVSVSTVGGAHEATAKAMPAVGPGMDSGSAIGLRAKFRHCAQDQSLEVSGAGGGINVVGGAGAGAGCAGVMLCRGGFFEPDGVEAVVCGGGRDGGGGAAELAAGAGAVREVDAEPGSGAMMLTAGVDDADGNSALVGRPVGVEGGSAATVAGAAPPGAFQNGA